MSHLNLGHWNPGDRDDDVLFRRIMRMVEDYLLDAITLNEIGDRDALLLRLAGTGVLDVVPGASRDGVREAILYRPDRLELLGHTNILVQREGLGSPRAAGNKHGSPMVPAKFLAIAEFRHVGTERTPFIGTTHPAPSVHLLRQRALVREHIGGVADWVEQTRGLTFISGDWNIDAGNDRYDLLTRLSEAGLTRVDTRGAATHGRREIDHWWHRGGEVRHTETIDMGKDHNAVIVRASYPPEVGATQARTR